MVSNWILYRNSSNLVNNKTNGVLFYKGKFIAYTLEDKFRYIKNIDGSISQSDVKVNGDTCIKYGQYELVLNYSTRFKRLMPRLLNVPNFRGILIHGGNTILNTEGCILIGERKKLNGDIWMCKNVVMNVKNLLANDLKNERQYITIINQFK